MLSGRRLAIASIIPLVFCGGAIRAQSQGQRPLQVSLTPATPHPGDVVLVAVEGAGRTEQLADAALGEPLAFHHDESKSRWLALIGIDLDTKPGTYQVQVGLENGTPAATPLRIAPKQFRVRRLRVPAGFVEPPASVLDQIAEDSARLADVYARVSPRKWSGGFLLPVDGKPSSNFGTRSYYNGQRRSPHAGVDFAGATGTPIRAANHGEVVLAAPLYFTGNTVVIDHGDRLFSVFAHLSDIHTRTGDLVEPTTIVGLVGATGRVTGPHLHWSIRLNGARVDPMSLVAATSR